MADGIRVLAPPPAGGEAILSNEARAFLERLHRQFEPTRRALLARRAERQARFDAGERLDFLAERETVRTGSWSS